MAERFDSATLADTADDPGRYVERHRFSPLLVTSLVAFAALGGVSVGFTVLLVREFVVHPPTTGADLVVLGCGVAVCGWIAVAVAVFVTRWVHAAATHRVALRADRDGITLGSQPYPLARAVTIPWSDLARVEIAWGYLPLAWSVGLTLRRDAPRPRGVPGPGTGWAAAYRVRQWWIYRASGDVARFVQGWTLDQVRLEAAVRTYAPRVLFVSF